MQSISGGATAPEPRSAAERVMAPGERLLLASPAERTMARAGVVALAYAAVALAIGWFPLHKVVANTQAGLRAEDRLPLLLFAAFGLCWIIVGTRLLWEPFRLRRLYPHIVHALSDRRFLAIDRRAGILHEVALAELWRMKIFAPFGRLTLQRTGFVTATGRRARVRDFDGVRDVEAVARRVAELTGIPVGFGRAAVTASTPPPPAR